MCPSENGQATATVEVLTAEVRVLMVGHRQVTLSVYRQLDDCRPNEIEPFGRVRDGKDSEYDVHVVGRNARGDLVRSTAAGLKNLDWQRGRTYAGDTDVLDAIAAQEKRAIEWSQLPLIVLAGLR